MNQSKLVSICIPAYNSGKYIEKTIESILAQTYTNIEIIICDNNSEDNTWDILKKYRTLDKRICIEKNNENIGYVRNIKKTVDLSRSNIIAIYHADDIYEKTIVEKQVALLLSNGDYAGVFSLAKEFTLSSCNTWSNKVLEKFISTSSYFNDKNNCFEFTENLIIPILVDYGNIFYCPSFMTRKNIYLSLGGFSDKYPSNEDLELWIKYFQSNYKLCIVNEKLLYYRVSETQGSNYWKKQPALATFFKVIDEMIYKKNIENNSQLLKTYREKKSVGYLTASLNAYKMKNNVLYKKFISDSFYCYKFSVFSVYGIFQRFPLLFILFRILKEFIKKQIMKGKLNIL